VDDRENLDRFPEYTKEFSVLLKVQMCFGVQPASYLMDAGAFFARGYNGQSVKLITHI